MSDLVAFLNARLDEDEATAREVQAVLDGGWNYFDEVPTKLIDPARVLREVEAKRRILSEHEQWAIDNQTGCKVCAGDTEIWDPSPGPCVTLRALAAVYSDHPDYDKAWA